jgi:hypothetical protein
MNTRIEKILKLHGWHMTRQTETHLEYNRRDRPYTIRVYSTFCVCLFRGMKTERNHTTVN